MSNIKLLKRGDVEILPRTKTQAVSMDDGTSFDSKIELLSHSNDILINTKKSIENTIGAEVNDIATQLNLLEETKELLKTKLTEKGLDVASENNFYNLADKVGEIQSGGLKFNIKNNYAELSKPPSSAYEGEYVSFKSGNALFEIISESGNEIPFLSSSGFGDKTINFVMPSENITINPK